MCRADQRQPRGHDHTDRSTRPQGAPPSDVGVRRLSAHGRHLPAARRPAARRGLPDHGRHRRPRRRGRHGQRRRSRPPSAARRSRPPTSPPSCSTAGARRPEAQGLDLEWVPADAENLPFDDGSFDVVMSCIGVMFAPFHQPAADELVRVCRPGGTIGLLSWTPEGMIGGLFRTMKEFAPPPPPGAQAPPLWGSEEHLAGLFGDRVEFTTLVREPLAITAFPHPRDWGEHFKTLLRSDHRRPGERRAQRPRGRVRRGAGRLLRRVEPGHRRRRPTSSRSTWSRWGRGSSPDAAGSRTPPPRCGCARRAWSGSG